MARQLREQRGFILIVALLTLAVIATLVTSVMLSSRARLKLAANLRFASEAEAIADGMLYLVILDRYRAVQQGQRSLTRIPWNGVPLACRGPSQSAVLLQAEDEGGKVDLNAAGAPLMELLLTGLGAAPQQASAAVAAIEAYRAQVLQGGRKGSFVAVQELAAALPGDPLLARRMLAHVTVHSRQPGLDETVTAPGTLAALATGGEAMQIPRVFQQPSASRAFRLRADVLTSAGARFVREAVVELTMEPARPYVIHEWLRGRPVDGRSMAADDIQDC